MRTLPGIACAAILTTLGGCAPGSPGPSGDHGPGFCLVARPILTHPADTEGTRRQVDDHNAVGAEVCGW